MKEEAAVVDFGTTKVYLETITKMMASNKRPCLTPMELVLKYGRAWEMPHKVVPAAPKGECYKNAFDYAMDNPGAKYVEGWACNMIPTGHAWCVEDGKIVDPTWGEEGHSYYGIEMPVSVVMKVQRITEVWGVFGAYWKWEKIFKVLIKYLSKDRRYTSDCV